MSINWITEIEDAKATNYNGMTNIVKKVRFILRGTDGTNKAANFFPVTLDYPDKENFIEFEDLKKDQIEKWVMDKVGEDHINALKNGITAELEAKKIEDPDNPVLKRIELPS